MRLINNIQKFLSKQDFFKLTEDSNCEIEDFLDLGENGFFVNYIDNNINSSSLVNMVAIAQFSVFPEAYKLFSNGNNDVF